MTLGPRVLVLGTGAMGSLFAARLAVSGQATVTVCGTWPAALLAMARDGIALDAGGRHALARPEVASLAGAPVGMDVVLVLVKAAQVARTAPVAARALATHGLAVGLQNGLGVAAPLVAALEPERVARGVVYGGAHLLGPARVRQAGPVRVVLGREPAREGPDPAVDSVVGLLRSAGLAADRVGDLAPAVWSKLAVNCALNPLAALHGLTNGELVADPLLRTQVAAVAREVGEVAAASGVGLDRDPGELALEVARATATNRGSMLADFERGAPTEIDFLCGAVVRAASAAGRGAPLNAALAERVRRRGSATARVADAS